MSKALIDLQIISEWDYEQNNVFGLNPNKLTYGSHKTAFWICKNNPNHRWKAKICNRTILNRGCPYCCHNPKASSEYNLMTEVPQIANEWSVPHIIDAKQVTPHSNKKFLWVCPSCRKEYSVSVNNRVNGYNCPYCSHQKLTYENCLEAIFPELAREWHPTINNDILPSDVFANSNKYAWWLCQNGHEWRAKITNRANGKGCKQCAKGKQSSFPEQAIYYYIKQLYPSAINGYKIETTEVDIFIPEKNIAIEYDGFRYHNSLRKINYDIEKNKFLISSGLTVLRIRESNCHPMSESINCQIIECNYSSKYLDLNRIIPILIKKLDNNLSISVDIERDRTAIKAQYRYSLKAKSLKYRNPALAAEWDYEANYPATPELYMPGSEDKVHWICSKNPNHKWLATIGSRNSGVGCPYCAGKKVDNENCLSFKYPELAKEWDYELNDKTPDDYTSGSSKKVFWKCQKGHPSYLASINSRTRKDSRGCPYCRGLKVCTENSFGHLYPELLKEWDYEKNNPLSPFEITKSYHQKVWWKCPKGHSYPAYVSQRRRGSSCAVCAGRYVIPETSLATLYPDIAKEWDYDKNSPLTPDQVGKGCTRGVWWKCTNREHPSYITTVYNRTQKKTGCKRCYEERRKKV